MVYVISIDGKPLMPTKRHGKVRRLLRDKKAKVIRREPFIIKLKGRYSNLPFFCYIFLFCIFNISSNSLSNDL